MSKGVLFDIKDKYIKIYRGWSSPREMERETMRKLLNLFGMVLIAVIVFFQ